MKNIIIIDGYNFIQRTRAFKDALDESLEAARASFIDCLKDYCINKRAFDEIIVVFDASKSAASGLMPRTSRNGRVTVMFSSCGESADDMIKSFMRDNKSASRLTVVSDDNYVANHARVYSADSMSCRDFMVLIAAPGNAQHNKGDDKALDYEQIKGINEDLKRRWRIK